MMHLADEELVDAYYGDLQKDRRDHLGICVECQKAFAELTDFLEELRRAPVPVRSEAYGREVWACLEPKLAATKTRWWLRPWLLAPVAMALLAIAFLGGMLVSRQQIRHLNSPAAENAGISKDDRERVLQAAIGDHLDRSEILLEQLLHADTPGKSLDDERARARDLLDENRPLRQSAARSGDEAHAVLLDDLERVLLDLANTPARLSPEEVQQLRERVENQGLLFKVRVSKTDARGQGRT